MSHEQERLTELCRKLKLKDVAVHAARLAEAKGGRSAPLAFLMELLELEVTRRAERRAAQRRKEAGFSLGKTIESFDFARSPELPESRIRALVAGDFIGQGQPVILIGDTGTGKTHLAEAIGMAATRRGTPVLFRTAAALITELLEAKNAQELGRMMKRLARVDLLIIDELGYLPLSRSDADLLFRVIAERNERKSTLVTTNLPFGEWTTVFPDARLCRAVVDRLTFKGEIIDTGLDSIRLKVTLEAQRGKVESGNV